MLYKLDIKKLVI